MRFFTTNFLAAALLLLATVLPVTVSAASNSLTGFTHIYVHTDSVSHLTEAKRIGRAELYIRSYRRNADRTSVKLVDLRSELARRHMTLQVLIPGQIPVYRQKKFSRELWQQRSMPLWLSIQRERLANGWDVRALQRELERLGIKVKPKPVAPKPGTRSAG